MPETIDEAPEIFEVEPRNPTAAEQQEYKGLTRGNAIVRRSNAYEHELYGAGVPCTPVDYLEEIGEDQQRELQFMVLL